MARDERDFLAIVRPIAFATITALIVFTVLFDNIGRLFVDPTFHVDAVIFATLVGSWTALLGVEGFRRLRNGNGP